MESYVTDGVQILRREWATLRAQIGRPRTCPDMSGSRYIQRLSGGQNGYSVDADWGVLDGSGCWRSLANTIEPSMCGGDVVLC